jgi:hypothetical protein
LKSDQITWGWQGPSGGLAKESIESWITVACGPYKAELNDVVDEPLPLPRNAWNSHGG